MLEATTLSFRMEDISDGLHEMNRGKNRSENVIPRKSEWYHHQSLEWSYDVSDPNKKSLKWYYVISDSGNHHRPGLETNYPGGTGYINAVVLDVCILNYIHELNVILI